MEYPKLQLKNVGQIEQADVTLGDLTVLVGPQATGKSIALQLVKLMVDTGYVLSEMKRYGLDWSGELRSFLNAYLGEGMDSVWHDNSAVSWRGETMDLDKLVARQKKDTTERMFYITAQRVLALRDGWPRPFTDFSPGDPFAVRQFSESLRLLLEQEFKGAESLFPQPRRLKSEIRELLADSFFPHFNLRVNRYRSQRRLVLHPGDDSEGLPFMVWSAGQREFVPLLLGFYWLMPPTKVARRAEIEWVVVEEPEMGLHPMAISATMLLVLDLLWRGYRVCLSTHSPQVLDVVWALQMLKRTQADPDLVLDIFNVKHTAAMREVALAALTKTMNVHYFSRDGHTRDISQLDPGSEDAAEAGWGGVSEFSGRVAEVVARAAANGGAAR